MPKPLVIIHGWSDNSRSFRKLARILETKLQCKAELINLADYISIDDAVTYDDLVAAMLHAWRKHKLPETPASADVVVHSTGGLIIRDWLNYYFTPETAPVDHLVMLAPANFGSPLAHKGQAFYGRILKGFNSKKLFQVGEQLLQGLELGSSYSWQLAMRDRFGKVNFYDREHILCTVLIGDVGYSGIAAAANEPGSDGTVRISTANLNGAFLDIDFSQDPLHPEYKLSNSQGQTAFGIMANENHSTIAFKDGGPNNPATLDYIVQGLTVTKDQFNVWCDTLANTITAQDRVAAEAKNSYQNTVFFVHDQFSYHIKDYFLEFYMVNHNNHWFTKLFYENVISDVHAYTQDSSYRSMYINCAVLYQQMAKAWQELRFSLTAFPEFKQNKNVGYRTFTDDDIGSIVIPKDKLDKIFAPHRSLLVEVTLRREQAEHLFVFEKLQPKK